MNTAWRLSRLPIKSNVVKPLLLKTFAWFPPSFKSIIMISSSQSSAILLFFSSLFYLLFKIFNVSHTLGFLSCCYIRQSMRVLNSGVLLSFIFLKFSYFQRSPVLTSLTTYTDVLPTTEAIFYCWSSLSPFSACFPVFLHSWEQNEGTVWGCCKCTILLLRNTVTLSQHLSKCSIIQ